MKRDISFDAAKGFAIFSVVISHIMTFLGLHNEVLMHFIVSYYMPLFFFISGFWGYKKTLKPTKVIHKRFIELIVPYLTVAAIINASYCFIAGIPFWSHYLTDESKGGFWFLLVLFIYFFIYATAKFIASGNDKLLSVILIVVYILLFIVSFIIPTELCHLLSLSSIRKFFPIFLLGLLIRKYESTIHPWSVRCFIIASIVYITTILLTFLMQEKSVMQMMVWSIGAFFCPVSYIGLFKRSKFLSSIFSTCGRYSITIYIYHYIFIYFVKIFTTHFHLTITGYGIITNTIIIMIGGIIITWLCTLLGSKVNNFKYKTYLGL